MRLMYDDWWSVIYCWWGCYMHCRNMITSINDWYRRTDVHSRNMRSDMNGRDMSRNVDIWHMGADVNSWNVRSNVNRRIMRTNMNWRGVWPYVDTSRKWMPSVILITSSKRLSVHMSVYSMSVTNAMNGVSDTTQTTHTTDSMHRPTSSPT